MTDKRRDIPTPSSPSYPSAVREYIQTALGRTGNALDKVVTFRELKSLGLVTGGSGIGGSGGFFPVPGGGPGGGGYTPDLTPPPTPTGFSVDSGVSYVFMETDQPLFTMGHGYERTNVYGKIRVAGDPAPTFADAVQITDFIGTIGAYATNPVTTWHLWVTWVTRDGVESLAPAGGTNGMVATTGQDVRSLLNAITKAAEAPGAPFSRLAVRAGLFYVANDVANTTTPLFSVVTAPITMNGVPVPTGVYMADAFVMNGTITNAKIANLAVDNAKIANLAVSKILAGSMVVGQFINSANYISGVQGWSINAAGNVEFSNAVVRGTVYASAGSIGGILMHGSALYSSNWAWQSAGFYLGSGGEAYFNNVTARGALMGGAYTSYGWPAAGQTGFYLGADGLLVGNANNGRYFQLDSQGNVYAPNFSIVNGNAYFNGSGTFNGNGTFTGNLSAAGGTFTGALTAPHAQVDTLNVAGEAITSNRFAAWPPTQWWRPGAPLASVGMNMPAVSSGVLVRGSAVVAFSAGEFEGAMAVFLIRNNDDKLIAETTASVFTGATIGVQLPIYLEGFDSAPLTGYNEYSIRVGQRTPASVDANGRLWSATVVAAGGKR